MDSLPLISIVIPAYNASTYIEDAIKSVLEQSYLSWELFVVNDCSTDNTSEIVKRYVAADRRIKLININKNMGGPAGPRNLGIKAANGDWVALLDADDVWHRDKLKVQMEVIRKTGASFCSAKMFDFNADKKPIFEPIDVLKTETISYHQQLVKMRTPTSSVVATRKLLIKFPFSEDGKYVAREDYLCFLHCHELIEKSVKILNPLVAYRLTSGQISRNKLTMIARHFILLRNYKNLAGTHFSVFSAFLYTFTHFTGSIYVRKIRKVL